MLFDVQIFFHQILLSNSHGLNIDHIQNMIVNSIIHGLIYGVIFKFFHTTSASVALIITVLVVGGIWYFFKRRG